MPSLKKQYSYKHRGWSYPTLDFVLELHEAALEFGGIAGFKDGRDGYGMVASAVDAPIRAGIDGDYYPSKFDKVAALGWLIARNHGFNDANKRTATAVVLQTLEWNGEYPGWSEDTQFLIFRLVGFGALTKEGLKFALLDACEYDVNSAEVFTDT